MYHKGYEGQEGCEAEMEGGWMGCMEHMHHWPKKMKKEFKMALLKKKEKMLEAKLEFVREMRRLAEKMGDEKEEKEEEKE